MDYCDERELIAGILSNDELALRKFYQRYAPKILAYARGRISDEKDREELVMDTLFASLEAFRDFMYRSSLTTFVISIEKRKIVDYYRRKKIKKIVFSQLPQAEHLMALVVTPEEALDDTLLKKRITKAFRRIRPKHRSILIMKYLEGVPVTVIAKSLSMSFKSAESALFRARKAFGAAFAETGESV